jgi:hypothetical protein
MTTGETTMTTASRTARAARLCLTLLAALLVMPQLFLSLCSGLEPEVTPKEKGNGLAPLSREEAALVRKAVYTSGLATALPIQGRWAGNQILVVPNELTELHKKKRVPTLHLLLEIVKGGRPVDAVAATAYVVALEENPLAAAPYATYPFDMVDDTPATRPQTGREDCLKWVTKLIAAAEKQQGK